MQPRDYESRFWVKVDGDGGPGCWQWAACKDAFGYGRFSRGHGYVSPAHRVAYELAVGEIPQGYLIDHLCRNTSCVNPAHLEAVPPRLNQLRGFSYMGNAAAKRECLRGHPYDDANTRIASGRRTCRACDRDKARVRRAALRAAA